MIKNKQSEKQTTNTTPVIQNRTISSYLNKEYLNYCFSVLEERALPSIVDGFKPGARKIMHASLAGTTKDGKLYKLLALSGDAMRVSLYAHGDSSLNSTIVGLCQSYRDNLNPLESDSQVGSLRDPDACSSPRYLYLKHSPFMEMYKTDYDLLDFVFEEGQYVEPTNYLPIIPTLLCKNNIGLAIGYSMHNQAYNPINIIDACKDILKTGEIKTQIRPYLRGIKDKNWRYIDGVWFNYGEWKFDTKKDLMFVTDLPADISYEQFEKLLNKLEDSGYIKDWKNKSTNGNINYEILFPKKQLEILLKSDPDGIKIVNKFKLIKQLPDDLFWVLDENHKLKHFDSKLDIIKYFVTYRLTIYNERKSRLVSILEKRYEENSKLVKFIELVCKGKLRIRNRAKSEIQVDMNKEDLPISLISTPMSKVTIEERNQLLKENESIRQELEYIKNTTTTQMYINDLNTLKKQIEKEFKAC
jgi:DNA topoisomerase II